MPPSRATGRGKRSRYKSPRIATSGWLTSGVTKQATELAGARDREGAVSQVRRRRNSRLSRAASASRPYLRVELSEAERACASRARRARPTLASVCTATPMSNQVEVGRSRRPRGERSAPDTTESDAAAAPAASSATSSAEVDACEVALFDERHRRHLAVGRRVRCSTIRAPRPAHPFRRSRFRGAAPAAAPATRGRGCRGRGSCPLAAAAGHEPRGRRRAPAARTAHERRRTHAVDGTAPTAEKRLGNRGGPGQRRGRARRPRLGASHAPRAMARSTVADGYDLALGDEDPLVHGARGRRGDLDRRLVRQRSRRADRPPRPAGPRRRASGRSRPPSRLRRGRAGGTRTPRSELRTSSGRRRRRADRGM